MTHTHTNTPRSIFAIFAITFVRVVKRVKQVKPVMPLWMQSAWRLGLLDQRGRADV